MTILHYIYFVLLYGTILLFASQYKKWNYTLRLVFIYLAVVAVIDTLALYIMFRLHKNNLQLFHLKSILEYVLFSLMYIDAFRNKKATTAVRISMYGFAVTSIFLSVLFGLQVNNTYARLIETLLITTWVIVYFRQLYAENKSFTTEPLFWAGYALLFYLVGTLFIEGSLNYLYSYDKKLARSIYKLEYFFEYMLILVMNIALFCRRLFHPYNISDAPFRNEISVSKK